MPYGIVESKKGELVTVILERQDMCGECHACEMVSGKKACRLTCRCEVPCKTGDKVEIELTQDKFLGAAYLMYGVPLIGFILGIASGYGLGNMIHVMKDGCIIIMAVLGTGAGFYILRRKEKQAGFKKYLPQVTGREKSK